MTFEQALSEARRANPTGIILLCQSSIKSETWEWQTPHGMVNLMDQFGVEATWIQFAQILVFDREKP